MRRKKPYPEECILIPITRESKPCIENKCYQWDSEQSKCKLIVAIQKWKYENMRLWKCWSERGNMTKCKRCGKKLTFRNNFGGICEKCYDKRLKEEKEK